MITTKEIMEKELKNGREYLYIGGERYRKGDCLLLSSGQEMTVKEILDQTHFMDERGFNLHSFMFHDQKWQHCPERNVDKTTKNRTPSAKLFDNAETERNAYRLNVIQNYPSHQVYDENIRIHFFESMYRYFLGCQRDPATKENEALLKQNEALLKKGDGLIADMYRKFAFDYGRPNISTKSGIEDFLKSYVNNQQELG